VRVIDRPRSVQPARWAADSARQAAALVVILARWLSWATVRGCTGLARVRMYWPKRFRLSRDALVAAARRVS
jgi:hypothetical protein